MSYPAKQTEVHSSRVLVTLLALGVCGLVALLVGASPRELHGIEHAVAPQDPIPPSVTGALPTVRPLDSAVERVGVAAPESTPTDVPEPTTTLASRERLLYAFTLREESDRENLEISGTLILVLDRGEEGQNTLEASVGGLTLQGSAVELSALTSEVTRARVTFGLDQHGALRDLTVAEGVGPAASQIWKQILGRWQVSVNDTKAQAWRASETTETGIAHCRYRRIGATLERQLVGYSHYTDPEVMPGSISTGRAKITVDDLPITIEGTEERRRVRMTRSKSSIDYDYTRISRSALEVDVP